MRPLRWLLLAPALLGAGALLWGCGRASSVGLAMTPQTSSAPSEDFVLHVPCVLSSPLQRVLVAYKKVAPDTKVRFSTSKPLAMTKQVAAEQTRPGVVVTLGEVEMRALVAAGAVTETQARPLARNTYKIAVIVPAEDTTTKSIADLVKLRRIAIEDPKLSTLGGRAQEALTKLGLWTKLEPKIVRFDPEQNVLSQLLDGTAEAAVVFRDCLFEGGVAPRTVRLVGAFSDTSYAPITYQVAPVKTPAPTAQVQDFVRFLTSAEGKQTLKQAGLTPP